MKIRIKTHNGELPSYLTVGKVYEASLFKEYCAVIEDDNGVDIFTYMNSSKHLNGGSWEIINE